MRSPDRVKLGGTPAGQPTGSLVRKAAYTANSSARHDVPSCGGCAAWDFYDDYGVGWRAAGENIAWNSGYTTADSPVAAETAFMNSPGHRANILDPNFTHGAIGAAGADNVSWQGHQSNPRMYTQLFLRPSGSLPPSGSEPHTFTDIGASAFVEDIEWLAGADITNGCSIDHFCPGAGLTRGQMAAFLSRALELPATSRDYFTDDENSGFEADINRLAAAGITYGCGGGKFCPGAGLTRGQMAAFLARALDLPPTTRDYFTDDAKTEFADAINRLAAAGITNGCGDGKFCPNAGLSRGEMAAFLHRALAGS